MVTNFKQYYGHFLTTEASVRNWIIRLTAWDKVIKTPLYLLTFLLYISFVREIPDRNLLGMCENCLKRLKFKSSKIVTRPKGGVTISGGCIPASWVWTIWNSWVHFQNKRPFFSLNICLLAFEHRTDIFFFRISWSLYEAPSAEAKLTNASE